MTPVHTGEDTSTHRCSREEAASAARQDRTGNALPPDIFLTLGYDAEAGMGMPAT
jgi:hypothetical protein